MKLVANRYGKARVRVLKILRNGPQHTIKEIDVSALLTGDFAAAYTSGDNSQVVATDTIRNTINVLAKQQLGEEIERFGSFVAQHLLDRYPQVETAQIELAAKDWQRLQVDGAAHPHAFRAGSNARAWAQIIASRSTQTMQSGIRDLVILKSTGSGWEGYPRDEFTTLPETNDRILATSFDATWTWSDEPANYNSANESILAAMLAKFANDYSTSAQASVYAMGKAALQACAAIARVDMKMPNKHYLLINLKPFGLENQNDIFVPTDDPFGQIEGSVTRDE